MQSANLMVCFTVYVLCVNLAQVISSTTTKMYLGTFIKNTDVRAQHQEPKCFVRDVNQAGSLQNATNLLTLTNAHLLHAPITLAVKGIHMMASPDFMCTVSHL